LIADRGERRDLAIGQQMIGGVADGLKAMSHGSVRGSGASLQK
jgi:FKBP-type peptidyl-prolyl cis-trans isomerase